jgi:thiol-disulfide isomerase/thioredoxin
MDVPQQSFKSIYGKPIQVGGRQNKPTVINLWFIECKGCVSEIPALNRLQEKYSDKVNFIALAINDKNDVIDFLKEHQFNFEQIANDEKTNVDEYIKQIGSYPYPETIFVDRSGQIRFIEGPLNGKNNLDAEILHFESILKELLQ